MRAVVDHRGQIALNPVEHILADNGERDARRSEILLRAAVDHGVLAHVARTAQDVGTHVGDHGHRRIEVGRVLRTVDRVVGRDVQVVQIGGDVEAFGDVGEIPVLGRGDDFGPAVTLGLLDRLLRPDAGIDVSRLGIEEIGGHLEEVGAGAAADEDDLVVIGNIEQFAQQRIRLSHHLVELLRAV